MPASTCETFSCLHFFMPWGCCLPACCVSTTLLAIPPINSPAAQHHAVNLSWGAGGGHQVSRAGQLVRAAALGPFSWRSDRLLPFNSPPGRYPVALIALFNLADCLGKSVPAVEALRLRAQSPLLAAAVARLIFVPAFHLSASHGAGAVATGALTLLLGLSNGYLTSCVMIAAPEGLRGRRAALVGNLMVFALVMGLCLGATCGFLWLM